MLWNTKKEIPIGNGRFRRKSPTELSVETGVATTKNLYLKKARRQRLNTIPVAVQAGPLMIERSRKAHVPRTAIKSKGSSSGWSYP